ncbi:MAG: hypothetical protein CL911_05025 [Deltaproteobacteria bacterium]|nr:hypothetical protein [Deltaproteobacteria bacterium]
MKRHFDTQTEQHLLGEYLAHLAHRTAELQGERIRRTCEEFRRMQLGETMLLKTYSTEWVLRWIQGTGTELKHAVRISRIKAVGRWWAWLFQNSFLDDNVLACFYPCSQVLRHDEPLVLWQNLQRPIACYLEERGPRQLESRRKVSRLLINFNVFLHRNGRQTTDRGFIDEGHLIDWLRHLSETKCLHSLTLAAETTNSFLRFLLDKGHIDENPLALLRRRYSATRWDHFLAGFLELQDARLQPAVPVPRSVSCIAPQLQAFVDLKRAMGRRYESSEAILKGFDRFVAGSSGAKTTVTKEIVDAWMESLGHLMFRSRKRRLRLVRQFCLYLSREEADAYVPESTLINGRDPQFKPHIYTAEEFRRLLKAALSLPARRGSIRPMAIHTALLILYGTGLRVGEALRLRLADVDLMNAMLTIRDTKFFKSRVVPISGSLTEAIHNYLNERLKASASSEAFLFLNDRGGRYSTDKFGEIFRSLLVSAEATAASGQRRPRVHDIRHTFVVNCVLRWYREGADLQAKLPILATYVGHASVLSTQEYLKATPELLREASERFECSYGSLLDLEANGENR